MVSLASVIGIRKLAEAGRDNIEGKENSLRSLAQINGCSDQYTNVPLDEVSGIEKGAEAE